MDIIEKLNRMLSDTTAHAMGSVDISQGPYSSIGMQQRKKKKKRCHDGDDMHEDVVTELAAFLKRRSREKQQKLVDRQRKIQADRYKLTPAELKRRQDSLEAAKAKARQRMFADLK